MMLAEGRLRMETATIQAGQRYTSSVKTGGFVPCKIELPLSLTGTAMTVEVTHDGGEYWTDLYTDAGVQLSLTVAASQTVILDPAEWAGIMEFRLLSNADEIDGDQEIKVIMVY